MYIDSCDLKALINVKFKYKHLNYYYRNVCEILRTIAITIMRTFIHSLTFAVVENHSLSVTVHSLN